MGNKCSSLYAIAWLCSHFWRFSWMFRTVTNKCPARTSNLITFIFFLFKLTPLGSLNLSMASSFHPILSLPFPLIPTSTYLPNLSSYEFKMSRIGPLFLFSRLLFFACLTLHLTGFHTSSLPSSSLSLLLPDSVTPKHSSVPITLVLRTPWWRWPAEHEVGPHLPPSTPLTAVMDASFQPSCERIAYIDCIECVGQLIGFNHIFYHKILCKRLCSFHFTSEEKESWHCGPFLVINGGAEL